MKNFIHGVLKLAAVLALLATAAYALVNYWDELTALVGRAKSKLHEKATCFCHTGEADDFADWEE